MNSYSLLSDCNPPKFSAHSVPIAQEPGWMGRSSLSLSPPQCITISLSAVYSKMSMNTKFESESKQTRASPSLSPCAGCMNMTALLLCCARPAWFLLSYSCVDIWALVHLVVMVRFPRIFVYCAAIAKNVPTLPSAYPRPASRI